jgi:hypothetical protein
MINESSLLTPENCECVVRSLPMPGARILDVCAVRASYGHLLVLRSNGEICGVNLDSGVITRLCLVELPELPSEEGHGYFGAAAWRLHSNICGTYCAIVVDKGRKGIVVDTLSGGITMALDGGDYYEETVPFSACFLRFADKDVFVYRSAWNRLDAADPATGKSLTDRHIAPYEEAGPRPAHYLDYFHGRLWPSPDGSLILDDGWVWHPVSVPRVWSATDWLSVNPWESEDGASVVDLVLRDDWNTPTCWIGEHHVAMWGLVDSENPEGSGKRPGVQISDATSNDRSSDEQWPIETDLAPQALFSDGRRLIIADEQRSTVWDIGHRSKIATLPSFSGHVYAADRETLVGFGETTVVELLLPSPESK